MHAWTRRALLKATAVGAATAVAARRAIAAEIEPLFAELEDQRHTVEPIPAAAREGRRARLAARLAADDVDALVVEPGPTLTWLTDVRWHLSERLFALVLLADGSHFWICPDFEVGKARKRVGADAVLEGWAEHTYAFAPLAAALGARGAKRVAVAPETRFFVADGLGQAMGALPRSGAAAIEAERGRKDAHEQALIRRACELTQQALAAVATHVRPGHTGAEVGAMVRLAQERLGLRGVWQLSLVGPDAAVPHGADQSRPLTPGDVMLVDTGGSLHGYQSDITRTWVVGATPSAEVRRAWVAVRDAQRRAFEAIRPGVPAADIDRVARASLEAAGYGSGYTHFTHRLGHGIGLQGHEGPYLDGGNTGLLAPGMCFSDEPGVYLIDRFGVRIEDIVVVTEDGADHFGAWQPGPERVA